MPDGDRNCRECEFVKNCSHAQSLAIRIILDVKDLAQADYFLAYAAAHCTMYRCCRKPKLKPRTDMTSTLFNQRREEDVVCNEGIPG